MRSPRGCHRHVIGRARSKRRDRSWPCSRRTSAKLPSSRCGAGAVTAEALLERLRCMGISVTTRHHPPVFTVDEAKALRGDIEGAHVKNLFLRDKKGAMWLVVCREDRVLDLTSLAAQIGSKRLSFGSADRLMQYLGVIPGAVSPFAVVNDVDCAVRVVLDRDLMAESPWNFHPLDNAMTTSIAPDDMLRFLTAEGHPPTFIAFDSPEPQ